jgi:NitT/TauT family transport system substrate-binding protein
VSIMRVARPAAPAGLAGPAALATAAALAVAMLTASCSSSPSAGGGASHSTSATAGATSPGTGSLEKTSVVVGALPVLDAAPLYLAIKNGYFARQGLTVKPLPVLQSTSALPDLLHGIVDVIGGNYTSYFEGDSRGTLHVDVVGEALNCTQKEFEILSLPGSGITSPAKLAGKTVAVNLTNNVQTLATDAILKADGVTGRPTYVPIPFPEMAAALEAHRVDAISAVEPFVSAAQHANGAVPVMSQCQGPTGGFPLSGYFATASWVQKYPNTARAFERAMAQAQAYANANPRAVRAILPSYIKITPAAAANVVLGTYPASIDVASLQRMADLMLSDHMLTGSLQVSGIVFK